MIDLAALSLPGSQALLPSSATREEREAITRALVELRRDGHAVVADEVFEDGELRGTIRILHYKTCQHRSCKGVL